MIRFLSSSLRKQLYRYLKWCHREKLQSEFCWFGCHSSGRRKCSRGESFSHYFYSGTNRLSRSWAWCSSVAHGLMFLLCSSASPLEMASMKLIIFLLLMRCNFCRTLHRIKGFLHPRFPNFCLLWMPITSQSFLMLGNCNKLPNPNVFL